MIVPLTSHPRYRDHNDERLMSKRQVADYYGYSKRWVELCVARGAPSMKLRNGHRRFQLSTFDAWLNERRAS